MLNRHLSILFRIGRNSGARWKKKLNQLQKFNGIEFQKKLSKSQKFFSTAKITKITRILETLNNEKHDKNTGIKINSTIYDIK